ncbi:ZN318 protein [Biomphalaria pfeifferi]|uniref:ZN318 protein n=1 Tax=Biomphalaria pfeifferi TaxID=112525 RepID=A0AAD8F559_BIOPF|nr:ZN318 protein [Biomphalaria pfeifferi]
MNYRGGGRSRYSEDHAHDDRSRYGSSQRQNDGRSNQRNLPYNNYLPEANSYNPGYTPNEFYSSRFSTGVPPSLQNPGVQSFTHISSAVQQDHISDRSSSYVGDTYSNRQFSQPSGPAHYQNFESRHDCPAADPQKGRYDGPFGGRIGERSYKESVMTREYSQSRDQDEKIDKPHDKSGEDRNNPDKYSDIYELLKDEKLKNVLFAGISKATAKLEQSLQMKSNENITFLESSQSSASQLFPSASGGNKPRSILKRKEDDAGNAGIFSKTSVLEKTLQLLQNKSAPVDPVPVANTSSNSSKNALSQLSSYADPDEDNYLYCKDDSIKETQSKESNSRQPFWSVNAISSASEPLKEGDTFDIKDKLYEQWRQSIHRGDESQKTLKKDKLANVDPFFKKKISDKLESTFSQAPPAEPSKKESEDLDTTVQNILQSIGFNFDLSKRMQELARQKKQQDEVQAGIVDQSASFLGTNMFDAELKDTLVRPNKREASLEALIKEARASSQRGRDYEANKYPENRYRSTSPEKDSLHDDRYEKYKKWDHRSPGLTDDRGGSGFKEDERNVIASQRRELRPASYSIDRDLKSPLRSSSYSRDQDLKSPPRTNSYTRDRDLKSSPRSSSYTRDRDLNSSPRSSSFTRDRDLKSSPRSSSYTRDRDLKSPPRSNSYTRDRDLISPPRGRYVVGHSGEEKYLERFKDDPKDEYYYPDEGDLNKSPVVPLLTTFSSRKNEDLSSGLLTKLTTRSAHVENLRVLSRTNEDADEPFMGSRRIILPAKQEKRPYSRSPSLKNESPETKRRRSLSPISKDRKAYDYKDQSKNDSRLRDQKSSLTPQSPLHYPNISRPKSRSPEFRASPLRPHSPERKSGPYYRSPGREKSPKFVSNRSYPTNKIEDKYSDRSKSPLNYSNENDKSRNGSYSKKIETQKSYSPDYRRSAGRRRSRSPYKHTNRSPIRHRSRSTERRRRVSPERYQSPLRSYRRSPYRKKSPLRKRTTDERKPLEKDEKPSGNRIENTSKKLPESSKTQKSLEQNVKEEKVDVSKLGPEERKAYLQKMLIEKGQNVDLVKQTMLAALEKFPYFTQDGRKEMLTQLSQSTPEERQKLLNDLSLRQLRISSLKVDLTQLRREQNELLRKSRRTGSAGKEPELLKNEESQAVIEKEIQRLSIPNLNIPLTISVIIPPSPPPLNLKKNLDTAKATTKAKQAKAKAESTKNTSMANAATSAQKKSQTPVTKSTPQKTVSTDAVNQKQETVNTKESEQKPPDSSSQQKTYFEYCDSGNYWCIHCNASANNLDQLFQHFHGKRHKIVFEKAKKPWKAHKKPEQTTRRVGVARSRRVKGAELMFPISGFYCTICETFCGDFTDSNDHLKTDNHYNKYQEYITKNPMYEKSLLLSKAAHGGKTSGQGARAKKKNLRVTGIKDSESEEETPSMDNTEIVDMELDEDCLDQSQPKVPKFTSKQLPTWTSLPKSQTVAMKETKEDKNRSLDKFLSIEPPSSLAKKSQLPVITKDAMDLSSIPIPEGPCLPSLSETSKDKAKSEKADKHKKEIIEKDDSLAASFAELSGIPLPKEIPLPEEPAEPEGKKAPSLDTLLARLSKNKSTKNKPKQSSAAAATPSELEQRIQQEIKAKLAKEKQKLLMQKHREEEKERKSEEQTIRKRFLSDSDSSAEDSDTEMMENTEMKENTSANVSFQKNIWAEDILVDNFCQPNIGGHKMGSVGNAHNNRRQFSSQPQINERTQEQTKIPGSKQDENKDYKGKQNERTGIVNNQEKVHLTDEVGEKKEISGNEDENQVNEIIDDGQEKDNSTEATADGQEKDNSTEATGGGQEKDNSTEATGGGQEKDDSTEATGGGQEKDDSTEATGGGQEKDNSTEATGGGQEKDNSTEATGGGQEKDDSTEATGGGQEKDEVVNVQEKGHLIELTCDGVKNQFTEITDGQGKDHLPEVKCSGQDDQLTEITDGQDKEEDQLTEITDGQDKEDQLTEITDGQDKEEDQLTEITDGQDKEEDQLTEITDGQDKEEDHLTEITDGQDKEEDQLTEITDGQDKEEDQLTEITDGQDKEEDQLTEITDGQDKEEDQLTEITDGQDKEEDQLTEITDGQDEEEDQLTEITDGQDKEDQLTSDGQNQFIEISDDDEEKNKLTGLVCDGLKNQDVITEDMDDGQEKNHLTKLFDISEDQPTESCVEDLHKQEPLTQVVDSQETDSHIGIVGSTGIQEKPFQFMETKDDKVKPGQLAEVKNNAQETELLSASISDGQEEVMSFEGTNVGEEKQDHSSEVSGVDQCRKDQLMNVTNCSQDTHVLMTDTDDHDKLDQSTESFDLNQAREGCIAVYADEDVDKKDELLEVSSDLLVREDVQPEMFISTEQPSAHYTMDFNLSAQSSTNSSPPELELKSSADYEMMPNQEFLTPAVEMNLVESVDQEDISHQLILDQSLLVLPNISDDSDLILQQQRNDDSDLILQQQRNDDSDLILQQQRNEDEKMELGVDAALLFVKDISTGHIAGMDIVSWDVTPADGQVHSGQGKDPPMSGVVSEVEPAEPDIVSVDQDEEQDLDTVNSPTEGLNLDLDDDTMDYDLVDILTDKDNGTDLG